MNLVIDIGNSLTKVCVFDAMEIVQIDSMEQLSLARLYEIKHVYPHLNKAILSSVADVDPELLKELKNEFSFFIEFNHKTSVPLNNLYESKETLGLDRLAAAVGAVTIFPGKDLLIIDAGTAVTFDLVDKRSCFLGGNISLGLKTRFRALNEFTKKLPAIESSDQWPEIGKTTEEAIRAGVK